jgi:hypothetical protein
MISQWKVHVTAALVMFGFGVAAPAVAWFVTEGGAVRMVARDAIGMVSDSSSLPTILAAPQSDEGENERGVVNLPVVVVKAPSAAELVGHVPQAHQRCTWHYSQTLSAGRVRVCDVARSVTGTRTRLLAPMQKRKQVVEHDTPSPSGLLDRR